MQARVEWLLVEGRWSRVTDRNVPVVYTWHSEPRVHGELTRNRTLNVLDAGGRPLGKEPGGR